MVKGQFCFANEFFRATKLIIDTKTNDTNEYEKKKKCF